MVIGFQVHFKDSVKVTHYEFRDEMRLGGGDAFTGLKYNYRLLFVLVLVDTGSSQNTIGDKLRMYKEPHIWTITEANGAMEPDKWDMMSLAEPWQL